LTKIKKPSFKTKKKLQDLGFDYLKKKKKGPGTFVKTREEESGLSPG